MCVCFFVCVFFWGGGKPNHIENRFKTVTLKWCESLALPNLFHSTTNRLKGITTIILGTEHFKFLWFLPPLASCVCHASTIISWGLQLSVCQSVPLDKESVCPCWIFISFHNITHWITFLHGNQGLMRKINHSYAASPPIKHHKDAWYSGTVFSFSSSSWSSCIYALTVGNAQILLLLGSCCLIVVPIEWYTRGRTWVWGAGRAAAEITTPLLQTNITGPTSVKSKLLQNLESWIFKVLVQH